MPDLPTDSTAPSGDAVTIPDPSIEELPTDSTTDEPTPDVDPADALIAASYAEEQALLRDHMRDKQTEYLFDRMVQLSIQAKIANAKLAQVTTE